MKIEMISLMAGPLGSYGPGTVLTLDDDSGQALVDSGHAKRLNEPAPPVAAPEAPEAPKEYETKAVEPRTATAATAPAKPKAKPSVKAKPKRKGWRK